VRRSKERFFILYPFLSKLEKLDNDVLLIAKAAKKDVLFFEQRRFLRIGAYRTPFSLGGNYGEYAIRRTDKGFD